jgi:hypothetical protein
MSGQENTVFIKRSHRLLLRQRSRTEHEEGMAKGTEKSALCEAEPKKRVNLSVTRLEISLSA